MTSLLIYIIPAVAGLLGFLGLCWYQQRVGRNKLINEQRKESLEVQYEAKKNNERVSSQSDDANLNELCNDWIKKS